MIKLTLLCAFALVANGVFGTVKADNDSIELHNKIYSVTEVLTPEETLGYLRQLQGLYAGTDDQTSLERSKKVDALLKVADVSESHCLDKEHMLTAPRILAEQRGGRGVNVPAFVEHFAKQQLEVCKPVIEQQLTEGKKELGREKFERAERLAKVFTYDSEDRVSKILDFISNEKKIAHPMTGVFRIFSQYKDYVRKTIRDFSFTFSKILYLGRYSENLTTSFDPQVSELFRKMMALKVYDEKFADKDFLV